MRPSLTLAALIVATLLVGACRSSLTPVSEGATAGPSVTPSLFDPPSPSVTPSSAPGSTRSHAAEPAPTQSFVGSVVTTLANDGLRVRSKPRVSDDSQKLEPLLAFGSLLRVLDGPVSASGYAWYDVVPLASRNLPSGWVASADRDGTPWIAPGTFDCPPVPKDVRSLAALPSGVGLVCFPRVPITVVARLIWCNCNMDGSWYTPSWFFLGSGSPHLLVDADVSTVPPDVADWLVLNLDPASEHPDALPVDQIVEVTGVFDHPGASTCTRTDMDGDPVSSQGCRLEFAVTRLLVVGP